MKPENSLIIDQMLSTSETIKKYGLNAKRSLGQNFILDANLTDKIARQAGDLQNFHVLEIGGGPGGLTRSILKLNPKKLTVIEQDDRCIAALEELKAFYPNQLEIIKGDALKFNVAEFCAGKKIKIIANLPYNIATELLFRWIKNCQNIELMILMFQKEVVDRITAKTGSKAFGRLAVMANFFCDTKKLFDISPKSFTPSPKVTSSLVMISPKAKPVADIEFGKLEKVCAAAFSQRRKMLKSSLKSFYPDAENWLKRCEIDANLRAEQLTLEQFGKLVSNY
ncbi:MAG: rRNA ((1518)-N(6)/adenine(1519)-N(6))-dimethyltransferase [Rickettsiaceae bacterium]|jgi:16S rRNA (adenine1518-N6/adenine1519-N6)-dimethyltransferase|nr:rRNA ((1518)-N(6)/adenine(1519)-N(6))-dimethyltransferase [Rickettsiaceae bacterium]